MIKQFKEYLLSIGAVHQDENPGIAITRLKRPHARITVDVAKDLDRLLALEQVFLSSLGNALETPELQVGQMLFSAMRYGTLLREECVKDLLKVIVNPPFILDEHVWYVLRKSENDPGYIWNPDPLTLLLIYSWRSGNGNSTWQTSIEYGLPNWFSLVKKFFVENGVKWRLGGMTKRRFMAAIGARLTLDMPASLVDCALGVHHTHTLHPDAYLRLVTGKAPMLIQADEPVAINRQDKQIRQISSSYSMGQNDDYLLRMVGRVLRSDKQRGEIAKEIREPLIFS